jgi:hypothetical protein
VAKHAELEAEKKKPFADAATELREAVALYESDREKFLRSLLTFGEKYAKAPGENTAQHAARKAFNPISEAIRGLIKQVDLLYKLATRIADLAIQLPLPLGEGGGEGQTAQDGPHPVLLPQGEGTQSMSRCVLSDSLISN